MNESKSPEMLNAFRWEVLCNRIERASQADFDFIVCALQQSRKTSSEALAWAVDTLIANSRELDAPVGPVSDIQQITKEMRDAAGDFESWGRDVINAFADRIDATAAPVVVGEDGFLREALKRLSRAVDDNSGSTVNLTKADACAIAQALSAALAGD